MQQREPIVEGAACAVELAHQVTGSVPVGMGPEGVAVDAAGRRAFVACSRSNVVAMVGLDGDPAPWQAAVGREPIPVVFDEPTGRVFTANAVRHADRA